MAAVTTARITAPFSRRSLIAAGVQVRLCGQAMAGNGIMQADLAPGVSVDLAALMTVIHLQQAGYALVVN